MMRPAQRSSKRLSRAYEVQCETTVKHIQQSEEQEDGVVTIREAEYFSSELTLVYSSGKIAILK